MVDKKTIRKGFVSIGTVLILMLATPFLGTAIIGMQTADQIYKTTKEIPQKEVALVLGAAAYPSRLSDVLKDRVDTAIELYEAEKISALVMSGAPNEVEAMKDYAIGQNIPEEAITEDITGLNTMASVKNFAELNRSVIIVTQKYHLPRALFIANALGIDAIGMAADRSEYTKIFEFKKRELLATSKAILDLFFLN
ncbi:YdcF family protein [Patescibacteria group bacterium]|nr:YdcF family protein [Patescibacteria group bacterium]MBU1015654.1 YdcF family protein [Patescibacteria group bacterium]MBU1684771.1 YdcF family protein [Patescibacteria group bacterium]MBU1938205.1 YdcF family protein [Patescibacteria group bacterium]